MPHKSGSIVKPSDCQFIACVSLDQNDLGKRQHTKSNGTAKEAGKVLNDILSHSK